MLSDTLMLFGTVWYSAVLDECGPSGKWFMYWRLHSNDHLVCWCKSFYDGGFESSFGSKHLHQDPSRILRSCRPTTLSLGFGPDLYSSIVATHLRLNIYRLPSKDLPLSTILALS